MGDIYYIVTGGYDESVKDALDTVAKYSPDGFLQYLSSLNQRRDNHACSSFISESGETVGFILYIKPAGASAVTNDSQRFLRLSAQSRLLGAERENIA